MKKKVWDIRIPNFAAFLLLLISIGVTIFLLKDRITLTGQASPDVLPEKITISNVTDKSFTVSFVTREKSKGAVVLENTANLNTLFPDEQETEEEKEFTSHFIVVDGLQSETSYSFSILSKDKKYLDGEAFFTVKTGAAITEEPVNSQTASGKVSLPTGEDASQVLVYLIADNASSLATLTKKNGTFQIPLANLRTPLLNAYQYLAPNDIVTLTIQSENMQSTVKVLSANIENMPPITLTENYDFTTADLETNIASSAALLSPLSGTVQTAVRITSPTANASIVDSRPQIRGTAAPNQSVTLSISPDRISTTVPVSTSGNWFFRPATQLPQGKHTITIQAKDGAGISKTVTQGFTVLPSGSQIQDSASASATPSLRATATPTRAQSLTLTPRVSISPTATPSATPTVVVLTNTPIPTFPPTFTPTVPVKVIPTVEPPGASSTLVLTGVSLFFIVTGAVLFFIIS